MRSLKADSGVFCTFFTLSLCLVFAMCYAWAVLAMYQEDGVGEWVEFTGGKRYLNPPPPVLMAGAPTMS